MNTIKLNTVIGRGSHGTVYQGLWHDKKVAIKQVKKSRDTVTIHHEISFIQKVHHPNIVEFHDVIIGPEHIYIVMDLIDGKNALQTLETTPKIHEAKLKTWTKYLAQALQTLHEHGYVYNDMKPSNIMLRTCDETPVLVDFGSTIKIPKKQILQKPLGTPIYFAPEKLTWNYGTPSDVWSLGITLYKLASGNYPFLHGKVETLMELEYAILYHPLVFHDEVWLDRSPQLMDLITSMLCRDPEQRISSSDILKHAWFL